jgi:hypothetical protein
MRFLAMAGVVGALVAGSLAAPAVDAAAPRASETTTVGVHNTYEQATYDYLAHSLDGGAALIELDVWPNIVTGEWKVSHGDPLGNANNCVAARSAAELYTGGRNKNLEHCLDDVRVWYDVHPDRGPLLLKLEMKTGFSGNGGLGPAQLDTTLREHLGARVFKPADLLGGHSTLDEAAKANAWPSRDALKGKIVVQVIPGTVEEGNPTDSLHTDVEYARHLSSLSAAGRLGEAQVFPAVHGAVAGDPRGRYDAGLRPWFVVFDGDAGAYAGGIDTGWYDRNHYLVVMTDAHNVAPAIDSRTPSAAQGRDRVARLAKAHASVVTSDWAGLPDVLGLTLHRG